MSTPKIDKLKWVKKKKNIFPKKIIEIVTFVFRLPPGTRTLWVWLYLVDSNIKKEWFFIFFSAHGSDLWAVGVAYILRSAQKIPCRRAAPTRMQLLQRDRYVTVLSTRWRVQIIQNAQYRMLTKNNARTVRWHRFRWGIRRPPTKTGRIKQGSFLTET